MPGSSPTGRIRPRSQPFASACSSCRRSCSPARRGTCSRALGEVAEGRAFLLQAGDCVESFREVSAVGIREKLKVLLQMSAVLTYGATLPVVKVGRIAGQFAKPRSAPTEVVDGVELPSFRGHVVHSDEASVAARVPDPERMLQGYYQAASTLNLLRAFTKGGFADLTQVHTWNQEFVASSAEGRRYETIANEIGGRCASCSRSGSTSGASGRSTRSTSTRATRASCSTTRSRSSARTRSPASGTTARRTCSGSVTGRASWTARTSSSSRASTTRSASSSARPRRRPTCVALCERLNPDRVPGRLTLIARSAPTGVEELLPPLLSAVREAGHPVVWVCDPMHANTFVSASGRKTRRFDDVMDELEGFFAAHREVGTWPGGVHLEFTGEDVTECLGGAEAVLEEQLDHRYETLCDPRLNARQSLDLAFRVAELMRG